MAFQLTTERIELIQVRLRSGLRLRAIAEELGISESALRWHLGQAGYRIETNASLVPIHAQPLNGQEQAA